MIRHFYTYSFVNGELISSSISVMRMTMMTMRMSVEARVLPVVLMDLNQLSPSEESCDGSVHPFGFIRAHYLGFWPLK